MFHQIIGFIGTLFSREKQAFIHVCSYCIIVQKPVIFVAFAKKFIFLSASPVLTPPLCAAYVTNPPPTGTRDRC